ncbi:MAG: Asp-tRNA(Asn)/Glu-tRNA(Gln) amidotransferase subunit GatC [Phycisphaerales bacterium]
MSDSLTPDAVRKVAALARLRLDEQRVEPIRDELEGILTHVARLQAIDTDDVEPMSHPLDLSNRLAADEIGPSMPVADFLRNAPAVEGDFLAVPKVLDGDGG